jgi:hypothetical protein
MTMSGSANRGESQRPLDSRDDDSPPTPPAVGSHMLEQILSAHSGGAPDKGFVEPADVEALERVARKLAGQPFALEPVAVELVHGMLEVQFHKAGISAATLRAMAEQIATNLYDDPVSRQRLEALWLGLSQK